MISILIPSCRPDGLDKFIGSLRANSWKFEDLDIVIAVDDDTAPEYLEVHDNINILHTPSGKTVAALLHECYKISKGDWIFFGNDDIVCETSNWDLVIKNQIAHLDDNIALFWINDGMFQERLACFPIVSRKVLDLVGFFPLPYMRYKVDDTLFEIIPRNRRFYRSDIVFRHDNDKGTIGFPLGDGRIYPIVAEAAQHDQKKWEELATHRVQQAGKVLDALIKHPVKVLIGVSTAEVARKAEFYDFLAALEKPAGTMMAQVHGQSPARSRNMIFEQALALNCTHVLLIDDDVAFRSDALKRLLVHDVDFVTGIYLARNFPHHPFIFHSFNENKSANFHFLQDGDCGLIPIVASGFGFCLIKTSAYKNMTKPYVRLGELDTDMWCDDIGFFNRLKEENPEAKCYADLDLPIGHMAHVTIWPNQDINKMWMTTYSTNGTSVVNFPAVKPVIDEKKEEVVA